MDITIEKREKHCLEQRKYVARLKSEGRSPSKPTKDSRKKYFLKNPWARAYSCARVRTIRPDRKYAKRGLKFEMTLQDFKDLWFRDKAYDLVRPSIDRIYSDVGYEKWNCRFIELKENIMRKRVFFNTQLLEGK
jgi:hypothetical protein